MPARSVPVCTECLHEPVLYMEKKTEKTGSKVCNCPHVCSAMGRKVCNGREIAKIVHTKCVTVVMFRSKMGPKCGTVVAITNPVRIGVLILSEWPQSV